MTESLKIGTVLRNGRFSYTIEKVLGAGGFGITYKVSTLVKVDGDSVKMFFAVKEHFIREWCDRDNDTGDVVVSPQMRSKLNESKRDFLSEARRLSQLRHSNIVRVYEQFEENDTAYYVMEYIEGENLRDFVATNGVMPHSFMIKFFAPLCEAVRTLHYNKMTHLDIKPANVMIRHQAKRISPVLIDFGLSKHYDDDGNATSAIRTQGCSEGYAPMEQYAGISKFSPQSDIYALAASMLYCLTGQKPLRADAINDNVIKSSLPSSTPSNIVSAIVHAMRHSRKQRTASVELLVYELNQATPEIASELPPPIPAQIIGRPISVAPKKKSSNGCGCMAIIFFILFVCALIGIGCLLYHEYMSSYDYYQPTIDNTPGYSTNVPGYSEVIGIQDETFEDYAQI